MHKLTDFMLAENVLILTAVRAGWINSYNTPNWRNSHTYCTLSRSAISHYPLQSIVNTQKKKNHWQ